MIEVKKLSELKGGQKFGTCNSCGVGSSENNHLVRITTRTMTGQGTSICLCENCLRELFEKIARI